ncbi:MAG: signal peptidase I [Bacteroidales bacterium]|jgi:signal peptidase I|nr:signal peptidase I [Bacteroidales bacterium]
MKTIKSILRVFKYIFLSLLLALLIRLFLCNFYRVPSDSMAPTVTTGDFIMAGKLKYGARIFTSLRFGKHEDPRIKRVPGLGKIHRNDLTIFNFPYRDTWDTIRMNLNTIFVKRCIGLPGDSLSAAGGFYHVSGLPDTLGYRPGQRQLVQWRSTLDSVIIRAVAFDKSFDWDVFDFGPFYIPAAGRTITLTPENFKLYHKQMVYETKQLVLLKDSSVYINDTLAPEYTFRTNWYFMAGDNVMNSQDSRYIGLIPEAYIIGRVSMIVSSKDLYTGKRRWKRTMKRIK